MIETGKGEYRRSEGFFMDEHLMYRNQLIKHISTLQSVDVPRLKRQLEAAQHDVVHTLYTLADETKTTVARNSQLDGEALIEKLQPFERALRGEKEPTVRNTAYDAAILQGIDCLDRLRANADSQSIMYAQVTSEIDDYLDALEAANISEIALPNDPYDSTYMIAKEEVPFEHVDEGFEVGQVHRVLQRGFIDVSTGAILRKASIEIVVAPADVAEEVEQQSTDDNAQQ